MSAYAKGDLLDAWTFAGRVAPMAEGVLLVGERGTGKTTMARRIHDSSNRRGPFVEESAANVPDGLVESVLAGHSRGSFTGAVCERSGALERAHHGSLFLDEIGDASGVLQAALLQRIAGPVHRLGSERSLTFDVRLIAATNIDLTTAMNAGRFRRDLYDRIPLRLWLAPLRERPEEIPLHVARCIAAHAPVVGYTGAVSISPQAERAIRCAPLPGNLRELSTVLLSAMVVAYPRNEILLCDLPPSVRGRPSAADTRTDEMAALHWALEHAGGNQSEAARLLGVTRQTIRNRRRRMDVAG